MTFGQCSHAEKLLGSNRYHTIITSIRIIPAESVERSPVTGRADLHRDTPSKYRSGTDLQLQQPALPGVNDTQTDPNAKLPIHVPSHTSLSPGLHSGSFRVRPA